MIEAGEIPRSAAAAPADRDHRTLGAVHGRSAADRSPARAQNDAPERRQQSG